MFRQRLLPNLLPSVFLSRLVQHFMQTQEQTDKHDLSVCNVLWHILQMEGIKLLCIQDIGGQTFGISDMLHKTESL
jgi:hypothetical protein